MWVILLLVWPPIKVDTRIWILQQFRVCLGDRKSHLRQLLRNAISHALCKDPNRVFARQQVKICSILRHQKVVIADHAVRANEDTTSSHQPLITVDPDGEVLPGFSALNIHMHALDGLTAASSAEEQGSQIYFQTSSLSFFLAAVWPQEDHGWLGHPQVSATKQRKPCGDHRHRESDGGNANWNLCGHFELHPCPANSHSTAKMRPNTHLILRSSPVLSIPRFV